jgi:hypothetical protein
MKLFTPSDLTYPAKRKSLLAGEPGETSMSIPLR